MLSSEMHSDLEFEIHNLEQQAYGAVLRAFKAQSDALTWEKEGLITELRKELRVSDQEHRQLLAMVDVDSGGIIESIRERRNSGKFSKKRKGPHRIPHANKRTRGGLSDSDHTPSQNGLRVLNSDEFEIMHTETLLQRIEQVVEASRPDPHKIESAKMILMEHEQALMHVIAKLAEKCDDGSDDEPEMGGRNTGNFSKVTQQDDDDEILDI